MTHSFFSAEEKKGRGRKMNTKKNAYTRHTNQMKLHGEVE